MKTVVETAIWAGVVLVLGLVLCGLASRWVNRRLDLLDRQSDAKLGTDESTLMERRTAALIAERTIDETVELRKAELARQTAETIAATALTEELKDDRIEAARRELEAQTQAKEELAKEFAREAHTASLEGDGKEDILDRYDRYMKTTTRRGGSYLSLTEFVELLERTGF